MGLGDGIFVGVGVQLALSLAADVANQGWAKDPEDTRFPLPTAPGALLDAFGTAASGDNDIILTTLLPRKLKLPGSHPKSNNQRPS